jgi:adenylate cyclase
MTTKEIKRKLTAILSADVKGYSRLIREDELGTIRTLNAYKELMANLIQQHHGRVVDAPGDNLLAEFGSVVDAVECAVEIQKELKTRNAELLDNRRMEFRIGINLGDVVEDGEQILGDGVNIAARLEGLSDPGGICISGIVYDQIKIKLNLGYEYLGEHTVKNIAEPIRVYRVLMEPEAAGKVIGEKKAKPRQWQMVVLGLIVAVIVIIAAIVIWKLYTPSAPQPEVTPKKEIVSPQAEKVPTVVPPSPEVAPKEKVAPPLPEKVAKPAPPPAPPMEVASKEKMAFPLPDEPSIAVLPFVNMSEDPKQEFFADGITEEITTALSKARHLFVISRQSTFSYKGKPVKVKQVSEELGVRYVLEGSVQRSGDRIRINAQLIDALTGRHIWAERFDRDIRDIFALQDEITMRIVTAIRVKLTDGEQASIATKGYEKYFKGKQGFDCYLKIMEGFKYAQGHNIEDVRVARRLAEETIAICPDAPMAYVILGYVHHLEYWLGAGKSPQDSIEKGIEMAQKAIAMDDSYAMAHGLLGTFYVLKREYDKAIAEGERSIALAPGSAGLYIWYGMNLNFAGLPEDAIPMFQKAIRLNPIGSTGIYLNLGIALRMAGKFEEAVSALKKALQRAPDNILAHINLAATCSMMGREKEAHAEAQEVMRINPKFSLDLWAKRQIYKDRSEIEKLADALRKAGLK